MHSHAIDETEMVNHSNKTRKILVALLLPLILLTAVGTTLLWPEQPQRTVGATDQPIDLIPGEVTGADEQQCQADTPDAGLCLTVTVAISEGPEAGTDVVLSLAESPGQVVLEDGDKIVLGRTDTNLGVNYYFSDFQRGQGLAIIAAIFCVFVALVARWRGVGAIVGLIVTYGVITLFVIPAILDGSSPVWVALTGSAILVLVVLYIAHGFSTRTTTAVIGTLLSLGAVGALATLGVKIAQVTGLSSEEVAYVQTYVQGVDIQGLLLGGIILGALGALNDMTVSQASSVWEIHAARPNATRRSIYASGMRVGRDHIASTVYTLTLAYTGAALPLLILFTLSDRSFTSIATTDIVAEEIVRTAVGGIGLMLSVPLTTALAAMVVKSRKLEPVDREPSETIVLDEIEGALPETGPELVEDNSTPSDTSNEAVTEVASVAVIDESTTKKSDAEDALDTPQSVDAPKQERKKSQRKWLRRRKNTNFVERPMTRRERKFWDEE